MAPTSQSIIQEGHMLKFTVGNRKSYFSVNVQVVGDPNLQIFDIVARWPGREHDSRIFNSSSLKIWFEEGSVQGKLLGDSAHASEPYLLTPVINQRLSVYQRNVYCMAIKIYNFLPDRVKVLTIHKFKKYLLHKLLNEVYDINDYFKMKFD